MIRVLYDVLDYGKLIAVSDAAYFNDHGPDEGDGPNYKEIVAAMTACGTVQVHPFIFSLNDHSVADIVNGMAERGFDLSGDEEDEEDEEECECFGECMYEYCMEEEILKLIQKYK